MAETESQDSNQTGSEGGDGGGNEAAQRPDYIDEKFWDGEAGQVRVEDLARSHADLADRIGKGKKATMESITDDMRAEMTEKIRPEVEKAIRDERMAKAPKTPNDYTVELPDDSPVKAELDKMGLVILTEQPGEDFAFEDGKDYFVADGTHPLIPLARKLAHDAGYDNDQFVGLLAQYAAAEKAMQPTQDDMDAVLAKTYEALGDHGKDRFDYARGKLVGIVGEEAAELIWPRTSTPSAKGVEAVEKLVMAAGEPGFSPELHAMGAKSRDDLLAEHDALMAEPDYYQNPNKQARARAIFQKLYPDGKAA